MHARSPAVPVSVLIETVLQPCGWLSMYMGLAASRADDIGFRNLDATEVVLHKPATPGTLRVTLRLERLAEAGGSTIVTFSGVCTQGDDIVLSMQTTAFGYFTRAALNQQAGLPVEPKAAAALMSEAPVSLPYGADELSGAPWLAQGRLQLFDRVKFWPGGGTYGLGRAVTEAKVDPEAWFFKAHFFQDPVQPGSLGLEAMQQAARAAVRLSGLADGFSTCHFEPVAVGQPFSWTYRGQVLPPIPWFEPTSKSSRRQETTAGFWLSTKRRCGQTTYASTKHTGWAFGSSGDYLACG